MLIPFWIEIFNQIWGSVIYDITNSELLFWNVGVQSNIFAYNHNSFEVQIVDGPPIQAGSDQVVKCRNFVPTARGSIGLWLNRKSTEKN